MANYCTNFQQNRRKTVGGVGDTKLLEFHTYLEKNGLAEGEITFKPGRTVTLKLRVALHHVTLAD